MTPIPSHLRRLFTLTLTALMACSFAHGESFTLTDKQGRSITADVLSLEGDKVKIKRDDGQVFEVSLATLSEKDQKRLKAWAESHPPLLSENDLPLQYSRGKFETIKESQSGGAVTAYKDLWGYSITLTNKSKRDLTDVRVEYVLFVKTDSVSNKKEGMRRVKKSTSLDPIPVYTNLTFRTETVPSYRYVLAPGWYWSNTGNSKPIKDSLHGMWLRIYVGKQLVIEKITSEDIAKNEKW